MPELTAAWNPARGVWETTQAAMFCAHAEPYSGTWPTSGSMRNGRLYPPPRAVHLTDALGAPQLRQRAGQPGTPVIDGHGVAFQQRAPQLGHEKGVAACELAQQPRHLRQIGDELVAGGGNGATAIYEGIPTDAVEMFTP